ncbi:E3 ubiquitin-protein ligase MARCH7 isoform X2 [Scyliorhinus canicula]|uniref:E3 ubiquitin-protein ligase MARCH7 isoform X2 n=1 Tax=Scyliorhinus canicula TaxID=7830 RepID=UPI0018F63857|nr:E3 ubiquitin-protein ligase MARCH7 isoform X2 [Scyliorhinus canicula]XP_038645560.1 E3 ubiquitin-protein ligase MARCH7 isoform X2 [Scyliorhinus canicula]
MQQQILQKKWKMKFRALLAGVMDTGYSVITISDHAPHWVDLQGSRLHHISHRDFPISEPEHSEHMLKLSTTVSGRSTRGGEGPWSMGFSGNRNRMFPTPEGCHLSAPLQSTIYNETDRQSGASSQFLTQPQNNDSKRPKLASTCSPTNSANCLNNHSDTTWRFPRPSVQFSSTSRSERIESNAEEDLEDRVLSSYEQGARPRDTLLGSLRRTTSNLSRALSLPSESRPVFTRDSSRNSSGSSISSSNTNVEMIPQRSMECGFLHSRPGSGALDSVTSERRNISVLQPRPLNDFAAESSSRCRPRQLLSRLASSMSSTFSGSRRSNQGHSSVRSLETTHSFGHSGNTSLDGRPENFVQANSTARPANFANNQSSETSQGFGFLRWRRPGAPNVSQSQNINGGIESVVNSRSGYSENRNTASWLSSSLRNRCTPLFNRRRREGRDETARMAAASHSTIGEARVDRLPVLQREVGTRENLSREQPRASQGATAASSGALTAPATGSSTFCTPTSIQESPRGSRSSGIAGMFPNSVIRLTMPYGLGDEYSDDILIAVDFTSPSSNNEAQEKQKTECTSSRDPEKLRKLQESLLLEDSDEEEGDICRICQIGAGATTPPNPLIQPCNCAGSLQYVHQECMKKWLQSKINSGADLTAVTTCELCKEKLQLDFEDFNVHELYRTHADEQAQYEFISSGLYLVLLLHLCEQRFSDMMGGTSETRTRLRFIHLARTLQQHIQDLETTDEDSEDEQDSFDRIA